MGFSVNTNIGAMAALQSLTATNRGLETTQNRINTGLSVGSTKDDSAKFTVAQTLRGEMGGLQAVSSSLSRAKSTVDVAMAGAEQISDVLNQMKAKATEASDAGLDADSRKAIAKDFAALREQISTIIDSSEFNGSNLLKGGAGDVKALKSTDVAAAGNELSVTNLALDTDILQEITDDEGHGIISDPFSAATDFDVDHLFVGNGGADDGATAYDETTGAGMAAAMVVKVDELITEMNTKLSTLGAASRQIDTQATFVSKLSDVIEGGIGNLVDADLAKESANLQALQVKQQLGLQALSIANQAPQSIMSLFR